MKSKRLVLASLVSVGLGATPAASAPPTPAPTPAPAPAIPRPAVDDVITKRVVTVLADALDAKIEDIVPHASLVDDLGADSLDLTELLMALEEEYNVEIDDEANEIQTVGDAVKYIESKLQ